MESPYTLSSYMILNSEQDGTIKNLTEIFQLLILLLYYTGLLYNIYNNFIWYVPPCQKNYINFTKVKHVLHLQNDKHNMDRIKCLVNESCKLLYTGSRTLCNVSTEIVVR